MLIHVVNEGQNIYQIAALYGISANEIIETNGLANENNLVVGQALIINVDYEFYTVLPGDSLYSIANKSQSSLSEIFELNPNLNQNSVLSPGEILKVPSNTAAKRNIEINGYAYPNISPQTLSQTLSSLTYLAIFSYGVRTDATLVTIDDNAPLDISQGSGVAPLMLITTIDDNGKFSSQNASVILNDSSLWQTLCDNILNVLRQKGYYGVDIDFEYVPIQDKQKFIDFLSFMKDCLSQNGYPLFVALAPKTSSEQKGLLYEAHDYGAIGQIADKVLIMTYEWGYTYGPPLAVAPINKVREVIDYALTEIESSKIMMGIPNYGYDWTLPYVKGTAAQSITNNRAIELAFEYGAVINYDEISQSPYFNYFDSDANEHIVWFEDARSINAKLDLIIEKNLAGSGIWNIMNYFKQLYFLIENRFNVVKK